MGFLKRLLFAKANNLVVILLSVALGGALATNWSRPNRLYAVDQPTTSAAQKATLREIEDGFANIADKVEPTVVTVSARSAGRTSDETQPRARRRTPNPDDENAPFGNAPFGEFFRRFQFEDPDAAPTAAKGSGVIVRANGREAYVLTNYHVVRGAVQQGRFNVTLYDQTVRPATLVGSDEKTDLAVLKFDSPRSIPDSFVAQLGDSSRVRVGQWAIAIGSPLEYNETLTVGVISAKGRSLQGGGASNYEDLIQTDAAINPGNSGGPLVNIDGEVVGINVAIASTLGSQGNIGIGFAIPVNTAKQVLGQLIEKGKVTRGWLGILSGPEHSTLTPALQQEFGVQEGALVDDVIADSPASRAGLQPGDVITRFNNDPIRSFHDLENAVGTTAPNTRVSLTIVRGGRTMTLPLTLEERKSETELANLRNPRGHGDTPDRTQPSSVEDRRFGLSVQPATGGVRGMEVVSVTPGSPAEDAMIAQGDVIQRIGRIDVTDAASFRRALDAVHSNDDVVLRVRRQDGTNRFLTMNAP
jgi:Do/DeqQ family serine protease